MNLNNFDNSTLILDEKSLDFEGSLHFHKDEMSTDKYLLDLFRVINKSLFNSEMISCRIKWSERIGTGKHGNRVSDFTVFEDEQFRPVLRLAKNLQLNEEKSNEKIAHALFEAMVHVWLWKNNLPWGHTPEFYEKTSIFDFAKIKKYAKFEK